MPVHHRIDGALAESRVGDVTGERGGGVRLGGHLRRAVSVAVDDDDAGPAARELAHAGRPHARGPTGDERDPAGELAAHAAAGSRRRSAQSSPCM